VIPVFNCTSCHYNFSGKCAWHSKDPDTYGLDIAELVVKYPSGCDWYCSISCHIYPFFKKGGG